MSEITPTGKRIIHSYEALKAVLRSFWYMRSVFTVLLLVLLASSIILFLVEKELESSAGIRPVATLGEAIYLSLATATALNTGEIGAVGIVGRFILLLDALIGLTFLGLIVWLVQFCLEETTLKESRWVFFATKEDANI